MKYEKCIFIRYKYGLKGYYIWNLETKKVVYSRDVLFREINMLSSKSHSKGERTRKY